jgi:predicted transcriptional regulator
MTAEKVAVARGMYESREHTVAAIAAVLGVSRASVYRHIGMSSGADPAVQEPRSEGAVDDGHSSTSLR